MHDKKAREEYERTLEELIRDYRTSEMLRSGGRRFRPKATPGCCPKPRIADGEQRRSGGES